MMLLANPAGGLKKPFSARYSASTIRIFFVSTAPHDFANSINHPFLTSFALFSPVFAGAIVGGREGRCQAPNIHRVKDVTAPPAAAMAPRGPC